jgi:hypothetical protein
VPVTDWLDTPDGKDFEDRAERVYDYLESFKINAKKRYFEGPDGRKMSLDQAITKVAVDLHEDRAIVREHVLRWMTEASNATAPEWEGTQEHVDLAQAWAEEIGEKYGIDLRL